MQYLCSIEESNSRKLEGYLVDPQAHITVRIAMNHMKCKEKSFSISIG